MKVDYGAEWERLVRDVRREAHIRGCRRYCPAKIISVVSLAATVCLGIAGGWLVFF